MNKNRFIKYVLLGAMIFTLSLPYSMTVHATEAGTVSSESKESEESKESKESEESKESTENKEETSYTITAMSGTYYATEDSVVYEEPASSGKNLGTIKKEEAVTVTGAATNDSAAWYQISFDGKKAFVKQTTFTTTAPASKPAYIIQDTNITIYALADTPVYEIPDTTAGLVGTLKANDSVHATGTTVNANFSWFRVTFDGKVGYVFSDYITSTAPTTSENINSDVSSSENTDTATPENGYTLDTTVAGTYKTTDSINVRSGPSKTADKIGALETDAQIQVLALAKTEAGNWYQIQFGSQIGYVSADYVTVSSATVDTPVTQEPTETPSVEAPSESAETAAVDVPQNDSLEHTTTTTTNSHKGQKILIIVIAIILILLVIGGTAFYLLHNNGEEEEPEYEYDEDGNLIEYDEDGNRIYYEDEAPYEDNASYDVEYDEFGNPIEYDEDGYLIEYDADGRRIYYDENGEPYVLTNEEDDGFTTLD